MSVRPMRDDGSAANERRPGLSTGHLIVGVLLVVGGIAWFAAANGLADLSWDIALALALIGTGLAIASGVQPSMRGGLVTLALVMSAMLTVSSVADVHLRGGVGERVHAPRAPSELEGVYRLAIGELTLDLSTYAPSGELRSIESSVGMGRLLVIVPPDTAVRLDSRVAAGTISIFGDRPGDGLDVEQHYSSPDYETAPRRLSLDLSVGVGEIEVRR